MSGTVRSGEQAALGADAIALLDALRIEKAIVAGYDWGGRAACVVAALWPERCKALVSVTGYSIINLVTNRQPATPEAERSIWSQFYLCTECGRLGYSANRYDFNKFLWRLASPKWYFERRYVRSHRGGFQNPDHVGVVIHSYRWRLGESEGAPQYAVLDEKLQRTPMIDVPTITIASDYDGHSADGSRYRKLFSGKYSHRIFNGIGHDVPKKRLRLSREPSSTPMATDPAFAAYGALFEFTSGRQWRIVGLMVLKCSIDGRRGRLQRFEASGRFRIEYLVDRYHEFFGCHRSSALSSSYSLPRSTTAYPPGKSAFMA